MKTLALSFKTAKIFSTFSPVCPFYRFISGSFHCPHPQSPFFACSDSHFALKRLLFVADGADSWRSAEDHYHFAAQFAENIKALLSAEGEQSGPSQNNNDINDKRPISFDPSLFSLNDTMKKAAEQTTSSPVDGACFLLLSLSPDKPVLRGLQIGDCGMLLLRKDASNSLTILKAVKEKPVKNFHRSLTVCKRNLQDIKPVLLELQVQAGDIIVLGTDGLWDNLFAEEILAAIGPFVREDGVLVGPEVAAEVAAGMALKRSKQVVCRTPFSEAARMNFVDYHGGKMDDITVVVAQIIRS